MYTTMPGAAAPTVIQSHLNKTSHRAALGLLALCAGLAGCQSLPLVDRSAGDTPPLAAAAPADQTDAAALALGAAPRPAPRVEPPPAIEPPPRDIWERMRRGFAMPPLASDAAEEYARHFAASGYLNKTQARAGRYLYYVLDEIERRGLPSEIALLGFVESSMNPRAVSPVGAAGVFQFMPATGRQYDMRISHLVDDRASLMRSTRGVIEYLTRLQKQFGDYHLAFAAYNWGEGNVARAQGKNAAQGMPVDYLSLTMPRETRNYVPQVEGLKRLVRDPLKYGVNLPDIANEPYFTEVRVRYDIDVNLAIRLAGISETEFFALNATVKRPLLLAAATPLLLLPHDAAERFERGLATHKGATASWNVVRFDNELWGKSFKSTASRNAGALRKANGIPDGMKPTPGSVLFVPARQEEKARVPDALVESARFSVTPDLVRKTMTAQKSDTLADIARRYKLKPLDLAKWNPQCAQRKRLRKGQQLIAYVVRGTEWAEPAPPKGPAAKGAKKRRV